MLIVAKKNLRDKYAKCLNEFLEHLPNQDENVLSRLTESLDNAINGIIKSDRAVDECFNYLQMIALEAYEAEFFKAIKDKIDTKMNQEIIKKAYAIW